MSNFKVGDLVQVALDGTEASTAYYRKGDVGLVKDVETGSILVDFDVPQNPGTVSYCNGDPSQGAAWYVTDYRLRLFEKAYTVLLLRPDYMADSFGQDTYLTCVVARSPVGALESARAEVIELDHSDVAEFHEYHDPTDYACLLLIEGEHRDINPER